MSEGARQTSLAERVVFWVGSICGIVLSVVTIYDRAIQPAPARFVVNFLESGTPQIAIVPPINTASEMTEEIPLRLKVENRGGKASANVKLYLTYNDAIQLATRYEKESKPIWGAPNEPMTQLAVALENVNPGESFVIPILVKFRVPTDYQRKIAHASSLEPAPRPLGFRINSDISSETAPSARTVLLVLVGRCTDLQRRDSSVFWVGHGDKGTALLKVQSDYPCI